VPFGLDRYGLDSAWFAIACLAVLAAAWIAWAVGRFTRRSLRWALVVLIWGGVIALTLTRTRYGDYYGGLYGPTPGCLTHTGLVDWLHESRWTQERIGNVALLVPMGVLVAVVPRRKLIIACALATPFLIEAVQAVVPALGRQCDVRDVISNEAGLLIGMLLGGLVTAGLARSRRRRAQRAIAHSSTAPIEVASSQTRAP